MNVSSNLVNVIDVNRTQADGALVLEIEPLVDKWRAFGWWAEGVRRQRHRRLLDVFEAARVASGTFRKRSSAEPRSGRASR